MTDGGATYQPGPEEIAVPFRARSAYVGYKAFGSGDGAVLVKPQVTHQLRSAAEFATQERRITGGLLYGRAWLDDQGAYLVVDGFLEAGPGENSGDRLRDDGLDEFRLSDADLRLLREDAARMYAASLEVGWWRTLGALGDFGPLDFETQAQLVGPDGVGLLVYGSGIHWGTAYLGPDGLAPDSAGTLVAAPAAQAGEVSEAGAPGAARATAPPAAPEPETVDLSAGGDWPVPPRTRRRAAPGTVRTRRWVTSRVRVPPRARTWAGRPASPGYPGPETPADVQIVVVALAVTVVAAAIIIGVLVSNAIVAIVIAVVGLLAIFSTVWMSRR